MVNQSKETLWSFDVEALYAICSAARVDWVAALTKLSTED
jgi:hypothetical protein